MNSNRSSAQMTTPKVVGLFLVWFIWVSLISTSTREYRYEHLPPIWDSLIYRIYGLFAVKSFFQGHLSDLIHFVGTGKPIGYIFVLGISHLVFGMSLVAPFIVSSSFAFVCLYACYRLAVLLGAPAPLSALGCLLFGCTPNFIFQNFFETRNDYALAAFFTLAWVLLLETLKKPSTGKMFASGVMFGFGTLMKMSAPGYIFWGLLPYWIVPLFRKKPKIFRERFLGLVVLGLGFLVTCGWHYIPSLPEILLYQHFWSQKMTNWQRIQYSLSSHTDFRMFYIKNIALVHLQGYLPFFLMLFGIGGVFVTLLKKSRNAFGSWIRQEAVFLSLLTVGLSIIFLTWNRSLAAIGDIPVLPILVAIGISLFSTIMPQSLTSFFSAKYAAFISLVSFTFLSLYGFYKLPHLQFAHADDFQRFSQQLNAGMDKYDLNVSRGMTVYSHPVYNVDTFLWDWLKTGRSSIDSNLALDFHTSIARSGEDVEKIVQELGNCQYIITAKQPMIHYNGEPFSPLNRFQKEISERILRTNQFVHISDVNVENGQLSFDLYVNKTASHFALADSSSLYSDGWITWEAGFKYMSLEPAKLRIRANPFPGITTLILKDSIGTVQLKAVGFENGQYVFESGILDSTPGGKRIFTMSPLPEEDQFRTADTRHLALQNIRTEIVPFH